MITSKPIDRNVKFTRLLCLPQEASSSKKLLLTTVLAILGALTGCADAHLPGLTSITVTPPNSTLDIGQNQQYAATGTFSDGSSRDVTNLVTWSSSNTTVASISASGLALGIHQGSSTISATLNTADGPITGVAALGVIVTLKSITITPVNPSIANGTSMQLTATGIFSDGSTQNLTNSVSWSSSSAAVGTVSSTGLVAGAGVGSTTITATQAGVSATTTVTVTGATLTSITVTPPNSSIAAGTSKQFIATGNYSDGTTQDLTTSVTWASSFPLATVSNAAGSQGLVMGNGKGIATITATLSGVSGATMLTVTNAVLTSIAVTPGNSSIADGTTEQLTATGFYSDGSTQNLTTQVSWTSSSDAMATVSSGGQVTGTGAGSVTITATLPGVPRVTGMTPVTVTDAVLTSIAVTPANSSIPIGKSEQLTATGTFSNGTTKDLTKSVTWGSSDQSLAIISNASGSQGQVTGTGVGGVTISATLPDVPGVTGSAIVTVTAVVLTSITVTPTGPSISNGATVPLTATGTFSDGSTKDLTTQVSWTSSSDTIAHVDNTLTPGLVTGTGAGGATITATLSGVSGATTVTVVLTCNVGDTTTAYNAIPFGAVNCAPINNEAFQAQQVSEFGNAVTLATGTGRTLVSLNVLFASYGCGVSGFWNTGDCITDPASPTFTWPITANIYANACSGTSTPCLGPLLATVTQTQTIPFRLSADPTCPDPTRFHNPLNTISPGGCQTNIRVVLTFTGFTLSPGVTTLPNDVIWTVAFNTSNFGVMPMPCGNSNPGCGYDSLNVGAQSFVGAPYAGTEPDPNGAFLNSQSPGAYCPNTTGGTGVLRLDTGCWSGFTPLGEVITH